MSQMHPQRFVYLQEVGTKRARWVAFGLRLLLGCKPNPSRELLDAVAASYYQTDELADQVVQEVFGNPALNGHQLLRRVVAEGSVILDDSTPALKQLLLQAETKPDWLNQQQLDHACQVIHRLGRFGMYALGDLALLGGYANSDIVKPLAFTGALSGGSSFDRVSETTSFWFDVTTPGGLQQGSSGYRSAVHVRIMHGLVRQRLLKHPDWNSAEWGLPINQGDALATNVAFSMLMLTGTSMLGWRFRDNEVEAVLHLWRYVAYLMGDNHELLPQTRQQGVDWLYIVTLGSRINPDEDSIRLAQAYLESFKQVPGHRLYKQWVYWFHRVYANFFIPPDIRRVLKLPSAPLIRWLPLMQAPFLIFANATARVVPVFDRWLRKVGRKGQHYIVSSRLQGREVTYADKKQLVK